MAVVVIPINSAKYGVRNALIDDTDMPICENHTWSLKAQYRRRTDDTVFYVATDVRLAKWKRVKTYMHRIILGDVLDASMVVDHIDGNPLNNTRSNLRVVSARENAYNRPRSRGYYWDTERGKWHAQIVVRGTCVFLGRFTLEADARRAHTAAKKRRDSAR